MVRPQTIIIIMHSKVVGSLSPTALEEGRPSWTGTQKHHNLSSQWSEERAMKRTCDMTPTRTQMKPRIVLLQWT